MRHTKPTFLLIFCMLVNMHVHAMQDTGVNLFTYGKPVAAIEDNFDNLFRNFPLLIKNKPAIKFLAYNHVTDIKKRSQAVRYISRNIHRGAPGWEITKTTYPGEAVPELRINYNKTIDEPQEELDRKIKLLADEYVKPGYKVYEIIYTADEVKYKYYVFINPATNQVVTKGNMFGFDFGVSE